MTKFAWINLTPMNGAITDKRSTNACTSSPLPWKYPMTSGSHSMAGWMIVCVDCGVEGADEADRADEGDVGDVGRVHNLGGAELNPASSDSNLALMELTSDLKDLTSVFRSLIIATISMSNAVSVGGEGGLVT